MKFTKIFIFVILLNHFCMLYGHSAEADTIYVARTARGVHFYGESDYPQKAELIEEMQNNSYNLLYSLRAEYGIASFDECRHADCGLTRRDSDSCRRKLAIEKLVKYSAKFLKEVKRPLTLVFYAGGRLFSELQLLIALHHQGINVPRIVIIDPLYKDFIEQFSKQGDNEFQEKTVRANHRIGKLLDILSSLNECKVQISVYKSAADFAAEAGPTSYVHHLIMAMDYQVESTLIHEIDFNFLKTKLVVGGIIGRFNGAWLKISQKLNYESEDILYFKSHNSSD